MMSTMSFVAHSHPGSCGTKARANSHDYYFVDGSSSTNNNNADDGNNNTNGDSSASQGSGSFHYDAYSLQRAMSSEARLPSREEQREQATHGGGGTNNEEEEGDDDDDDDLQYCPSDGDGLTLSSSNETDEVLHDLGASQQRNRIQESDSHRITPSPTRGKRRPTHLLQRHRQPMRPTSPFGLISRSVSDTTHTTGSAAKRILQTIESRGDNTTTTTTAAVATANMTPKPPPPRRSTGINSSRAVSTTNNNTTTSPNHTSMHHPPPHHQPQHSNASSFVSHYSIDAGKHGFLSHSPPPSPPPRLHSFSNGDDDSTADGGAGIIGDANSVVSNGSLVFKYLPGQETPPAEYALPVSILKVYGDSLVDEMIDHSLIHGIDDDGGGVPGSSSGSGQGARDDNDDIDIPPSSARRKTFVDESLSKEKEGQRRRREEESTATARTSSRWAELPLPPQRTILEGGSATAAASGTGPSLPEQQQQQQQQRILPYHERKRLSEQLLLEKEKQRRQKKNGANATNAKNSQQRTNSKVNGGMVFGVSENTPLNDGMRSDRGYYGDTTATTTSSPLLASNNNTTTNVDYDLEHHGHDAVANHVIPPKDTKEWFGRLVSIITGKTAFKDDDGDDREEHRKQRGGGKRDQDPKQTYRDQAEAFLKKTEIERMKISARQKNLDRSWAKRSSISAALDSIPSCSGEEEEEEEVETGNNDHVDNDTNETYSSSEEEDEEYGSYYFDNQKGGGVGATPSSTMAGSGTNTTPKVWKYGEPPTTTTTMDHNSTASLKKKHATSKKHRMSEHDLIMRRDRLLQEEYEYRLRALQREHANLSKKFRIFVLVTVAIIFSGALTFAFVVCVRMLMSL